MVKKGYKHTELGLIPEDWEEKFVEDFADIITGGKDTQDNVSDGQYLFFVRSANIERINSYSFDGEAVITSGDGVGVGKIFHYVNGKFDFHQRVYNIHNFKKYDGKLFYYFFSNHFYDRVMQMTAKSSVDSVRREMISKMKVPIPPTLAEQKAIAQTLTDVDNLITQLELLIIKKKMMKKGAMQELLTGKKRLKGFTGDWKANLLIDLCSYINDGTHHTPIYKEKGIPFYSVENITNNDFKNTKYISKKEHLKLIKRCRPEKGDILLTRIGTLGKTKLIDWDVDASIYVSLALIKVKKDKIDSRYLYSYSKSDYFVQDIVKRSLTNATPQKINMAEIGQVPIRFPSDIKEQQAIAQILNDMDAEIDALENRKSKTQYIKQGMMQELLIGKTRLVEPATQKTKEPLALVAKHQPTYTKEPAHNEYITDAVLIGTIAHSFASKEFPLTRFMYTKVSYLFKRYKQLKDEDYLKKAAGPYKPKTRYGGAEKIAIENKYIIKQKAIYKGKVYEGFVGGEKVKGAVDYFKIWYDTDALKWIQQFKYTKRPMLELWATVDMAMEDLKYDNQPINLQSVKFVIENNKEWKPKLNKEVFSDVNISKAIKEVKKLFD